MILRMSNPVTHPVARSPYPYLLAVFCAVFLISNITAQKGVELGPLVTDGAFFLFPISYVIGDVIAEVYGFRAARRAVFTGFAIAVIAVLSFYIAIWLPAADFYDMNDTFAAVLGLLPQIVAASLTGYVVEPISRAQRCPAPSRSFIRCSTHALSSCPTT